jgi:hypothetical protein
MGVTLKPDIPDLVRLLSTYTVTWELLSVVTMILNDLKLPRFLQV